MIRSESVPQLSHITLLFKRGTNFLKARQLVQEHLSTVAPTLPTWAAPPFMMQPVSATSRIMKIGLSSKSIGLMDLSVTTYWKIRARLLRVPGVANVAIWGERLKDMDVNVRPDRLKAEKVSLDKVMEVTSQALDAGLLQFSPGAVIGTGGFIETPNQRISARAVTAIRSPDDLAQVAVARRNGRELRIGDVAKVVYGPQPLIGDAVVNGGPGLLLVVEKLQGANTLEVTKGVEDALKDLRPGLPGVTIDSTIFRPASFVEIAIHNLKTALLIGCLLVILVLIAFLFEWRAAFISLVAIPLSLVAAGVVLDAARRDDQHHDPRRVRRGGRRGRGRRDHRHGEHRPADAAARRRRDARAADAHDPEGVARGAGRDLLRDAHQRRRRGARALRRRPERRRSSSRSPSPTRSPCSSRCSSR